MKMLHQVEALARTVLQAPTLSLKRSTHGQMVLQFKKRTKGSFRVPPLWFPHFVFFLDTPPVVASFGAFLRHLPCRRAFHVF